MVLSSWTFTHYSEQQAQIDYIIELAWWLLSHIGVNPQHGLMENVWHVTANASLLIVFAASWYLMGLIVLTAYRTHRQHKTSKMAAEQIYQSTPHQSTH